MVRGQKDSGLRPLVSSVEYALKAILGPFKHVAFGLLLLLLACQQSQYREVEIPVIVPSFESDPLDVAVEELGKDEAKDPQVQEQKNAKDKQLAAAKTPAPSAKPKSSPPGETAKPTAPKPSPSPTAPQSPTPNQEAKPEPDEAKPSLTITRAMLEERWQTLLEIVRARHWSQDDFYRIVPDARGLENYVAYGDLRQTWEKLETISGILDVQSQLPGDMVMKKIERTLLKLNNTEMASDQYMEFQDRISKLDALIEARQYNEANRRIQLIQEDLDQLAKIQEVF